MAPKSHPSCHLWEISLRGYCSAQGFGSAIQNPHQSYSALYSGVDYLVLNKVLQLKYFLHTLASYICPGAGTGQSTS